MTPIDYVRHGWALVPIPSGQKGPVGSGWNTREACITDPEALDVFGACNWGLAHAYSGTCALDIDDLVAAFGWFTARGIDLQALLDANDAVRIVSREGRAKLLYALPKPLPSLKFKGLEFRCGTQQGTTVQDVLPPSIHPDTGRPYKWLFGVLGDWRALPPVPEPVHKLWAQTISDRTSASKPKAAPTGASAERLRAILARIEPDVEYDEWVGVGMALHYETQGAEIGLELWDAWSSGGSKYKGIADLQQHWRSFRLDHTQPKTLAALDGVATADEFEVITDVATLPTEPSKSNVPEETSKKVVALRRAATGEIQARISNVVAVLGEPQITGQHLSLDTFQDQIMFSTGTDDWRPLNDADYTSMRVWLETTGNFQPVSHEMIRHAVHSVAQERAMDTAQKWLSSLEWDGKPRIEHFCPRYFGTINAEYERAVGIYLWTALAGRVLQPGCQVDMVPVLIGDQGVGKSRGVQAIVPHPQFFAELRMDEQDDAIARKMRGVLVCEFAEMRGLRGAEIERVKAFITRTHEKWTPKYQEFATTYARRFIIIGTANDAQFLPVDTEYRRWLPLHTIKVDVAAIAGDRDQLWAEAMNRWLQNGIEWDQADKLAGNARAEASPDDNWEPLVEEWLTTAGHDRIRTHDVLREAVGFDPRQINRSHEVRVARIMRNLGYRQITARRADGKNVRIWAFQPQ